LISEENSDAYDSHMNSKENKKENRIQEKKYKRYKYKSYIQWKKEQQQK